MSKLSIEASSDSYKDEISDLIVTIQNDEFGIPITLDMQPDLMEISKYYQVNNGNFWVARINNRIVGTIVLLDIGKIKGPYEKCLWLKNSGGRNFLLAKVF